MAAKTFFSALAVLASASTGLGMPHNSAAGLPVVRSSSSSRTSAPSGCISVKSDASGTGEYATLASAVASLSSSSSSSGSDSDEEACIFMYSGTYEEQVSIDYGGPLTIYGYTTDTSSYANNAVTITHSVNSSDAGSLDASSTLDITSSNFSMYNINIVNGYGQGAQAVAVTAVSRASSG